MKSNKRDIIIIVAILIIGLTGYFIFTSIMNKQSNGIATVKHTFKDVNGFNASEALVEIDFVKKEVRVLKTQTGVPEEYGIYPQIDHTNSTVTVLGEYVDPSTNKRAILVVEFNYQKQTVEIIEETSPKGICKDMGASTRFPLICIPNQISVVFTTSTDSGIDHER